MSPGSPHRDLLLKAFDSAKPLLKEDTSKNSHFIDREIKLSVDAALDNHFRSFLERETGLPVYSEESLGDFPDSNSTCWIVDPLDGSLNYSHQIPFYSSSICLWKNGAPHVGGIYDYSHQDFYFAEASGGAFQNDRKIQVRPSRFQIKATGIPSHSSLQESLALFTKSLEHYKKLRWLGCASLSMAYVASGRVDAYEELGIKLWDVAAGILLVREAGGQVEYSFNKNGSLNILAH